MGMGRALNDSHRANGFRSRSFWSEFMTGCRTRSTGYNRKVARASRTASSPWGISVDAVEEAPGFLGARYSGTIARVIQAKSELPSIQFISQRSATDWRYIL